MMVKQNLLNYMQLDCRGLIPAPKIKYHILSKVQTDGRVMKKMYQGCSPAREIIH